MLKVEILLDKEKIKKESEYTPKSIYTAIRKNFLQFDLLEIPTNDKTIVFRF